MNHRGFLAVQLRHAHTHTHTRLTGGGQRYLQTEGLKKQCQLTNWKMILSDDKGGTSSGHMTRATRLHVRVNSVNSGPTALKGQNFTANEKNLCHAHLMTTNCRSYIEAEHFRATV